MKNMWDYHKHNGIHFTKGLMFSHKPPIGVSINSLGLKTSGSCVLELTDISKFLTISTMPALA